MGVGEYFPGYISLDGIDKDNNFVGFLRSAVYSPSFKKVVGIAMIEKKIL